MEVNWFPGHMAKALRDIKDHLKQVDLVIETCDARIPDSSRNPELQKLIGQKPLILVLNKADIADPDITARWIQSYRTQNITALACVSTQRKDLNTLIRTIQEYGRDKTERAAARGRIFRPIRVMVVGIPNTGKSTLINTLCGRKLAITADRPGITRHMNWIRTGGQIELLDSPGVLWPKLSGRDSQVHLASTGAIRDEVLQVDEIAAETLKCLVRDYPRLIEKRYGLIGEPMTAEALLAAAALGRGCLMPGGKPDIARFSRLFLDEFRGGKIGRISLERPQTSDRI